MNIITVLVLDDEHHHAHHHHHQTIAIIIITTTTDMKRSMQELTSLQDSEIELLKSSINGPHPPSPKKE